MIQATKPTLSFGVLLLIALGLAGAVYYLSQKVEQEIQLPVVPVHKDLAKKGAVNNNANIIPPLNAPAAATDDWQVFNDDSHLISFKYPQDWAIKTYDQTNFDVISIKPSQGQDNIRIYITTDDFVGLAGLQTSTTTVGGVQGINANDMVVGVKTGKTFFTFDAGEDQSLIPEFRSILQSVAFAGK